MSIRIHRATGYGMPWSTFEKLTTCKSDGGGHDSFYDVFTSRFDALTKDDLVMTKEDRRNRAPHTPFAVEPHLLARNVTMGGRNAPDYGEAQDLYQLVQNPDFITDVIFFPNLIYQKGWYHWNDTVDYMFERFGKDVDLDDAADFTKYIRHGVYPYDKFLVDSDNQPLSYDDHFMDYSIPSSTIRGAVPHEIRWYLTKFGFLDNAGVDELRPVVAQWWC